jgi:hypothetical protein
MSGECVTNCWRMFVEKVALDHLFEFRVYGITIALTDFTRI